MTRIAVLPTVIAMHLPLAAFFAGRSFACNSTHGSAGCAVQNVRR
jgi:hypothetical protein